MEDYLAPAYYITAPIDDYNANSIYINAKTDASTTVSYTHLRCEFIRCEFIRIRTALMQRDELS